MKKSLWTLLFALLLPASMFASGWNEQEYKQIEQSVKLPQIKGKDYVVT
jgi:hypothetical protein